jgi:hypothetical protein
MGPKLWSITGARSHTATTPNRLYYYFILLILNELREPHQRLLGNVSCLAPFFFALSLFLLCDFCFRSVTIFDFLDVPGCGERPTRCGETALETKSDAGR